MPRTTIAPATVRGPYPTLPVAADSLDLVLTAADTVNKNQTAFNTAGAVLLLAQNSGASPYTITLTSAIDTFNRTGDITAYSLAAGDIAAFILERQGWMQSDGFIYYEANNAAVKFAVIPIR